MRLKYVLAAGAAALTAGAAPAYADVSSETLQLDTFDPADIGHTHAVTTSDVLTNGVDYDATVSGTYSVWSRNSWFPPFAVCGVPEPAPQTPSPGTQNGPVGQDADSIFAFAAQNNCNGINVPQHEAKFQIELNTGAGFAHIEPDGGPYTSPQPGHVYHFTLQGHGAPASFRLADTPTADNYGILTIRITRKNRPPVCTSVTGSQTTLWPPNHKFETITLSGATDPDGDPVAVTVTGVTQDEPVNGLGDGDTSPDAKTTSNTNQVQVRSERSGLGDGRVYRISFQASDGNGGTCTGTVNVGVPHDQGQGSTPVDSGQTYNSFGS